MKRDNLEHFTVNTKMAFKNNYRTTKKRDGEKQIQKKNPLKIFLCIIKRSHISYQK